MPLKKNNSRYIKISLTTVAFFISICLYASIKQIDSVTTKKIKIDGVLSVIGDYVILDSDIDKAIIEMESQEISAKDITHCELLEQLMENKLYAHHAIQDSLTIDTEQIYQRVDANIEYFKEQLGSEEKILEYYNKTDMNSFRNQLFEINQLQQLSQSMQLNIVDNIEVTPEEVKDFFESIPKEELPIFGTEIEIAQIVIKPQPTKKEEERVINQLKLFKEDVEEKGVSFASKAILYSQDPGSRSTGGKYTLHRKYPRMVKEFRDAAFRLDEGEVSDPFETEFGWHILQVDKIIGQKVEVRHILLIPKIENSKLRESKMKLDSIRALILNDDISFLDAALIYSDEKETKNNGGKIINPATGDTHFELTKMDPSLYNQIYNYY